jgi:hypothetical protein
MPDDVTRLRRLGRDVDVILAFADRKSELDRRFGAWRNALARDGSLWIAWPKRASGVTTDLTERVVRGVGLAGGLVDTKVAAIDEVWSGLRFVRRLADR